MKTRLGAVTDHRVLRRRFIRRYKLLDLPQTGVHDIGQAAGALLLTRRSTIEGPLRGVLFDTSLPILFNDVDLSRRVHDAGFRVLVDLDESITHIGGGSLNQLDDHLRQRQHWQGFAQYLALHEPGWQRHVVRLVAPLATRGSTVLPGEH